MYIYKVRELIASMRPYAIHHLHQRKRFHENLEPYPHPHLGVRFLDQLLVVLAIVGPLTGVPQLYTILQEKSAASVSVISWSLYIILTIPWIIYGFVHKEKPIVISSILWLVLDTAIVVAALAYS